MMFAARTFFCPSPRVRGEGAECARRAREVGEGAYPTRTASRLQPLTRRPRCRSDVDLSPQAGRGRENWEGAR